MSGMIRITICITAVAVNDNMFKIVRQTLRSALSVTGFCKKNRRSGCQLPVFAPVLWLLGGLRAATGIAEAI